MSSPDETKSIEVKKEKKEELSAAQRARIERNRQKALLLRQSRLQAHPYATDSLGYVILGTLFDPFPYNPLI